MEGERYKKSPELVRELIKKQPVFKAPGKYIVFKRWDMLKESDNPDVVIFFARPEVMSGLFTLCGFDVSEHNERMVENMEESFLRTESWKKVQKKISSTGKKYYT